MTDDGLAGLRIVSDLHLSVDGVSAELVADGRDLTLRTHDPVGLLNHALGSLPAVTTSWRDAVDQVGTGLDRAGLTARVAGTHGTLLELGAGCRSRSGRVLFGSDHARPGSPRVVVPVAVAWARTVSARPLGYALGASVLAVAAVTAARRARRRSGTRPAHRTIRRGTT